MKRSSRELPAAMAAVASKGANTRKSLPLAAATRCGDFKSPAPHRFAPQARKKNRFFLVPNGSETLFEHDQSLYYNSRKLSNFLPLKERDSRIM